MVLKSNSSFAFGHTKIGPCDPELRTRKAESEQPAVELSHTMEL